MCAFPGKDHEHLITRLQIGPAVKLVNENMLFVLVAISKADSAVLHVVSAVTLETLHESKIFYCQCSVGISA